MKNRDIQTEFERLQAISSRIIAAKKYLFIGEPYRTPMKPHKRDTYRKLCKMQDRNIKEVAALFG